jgi:two-component sensor histidine kinase
VVFTDVTARKEAREALQQTSERLRILHEIDTAILRAHSPDEIALAALAHLRDLLSCRHISLSEIDLARQQSRETIVLVDDQLRARAADWRPISRIGPRLIETLSRGDIYLVGDLGAQKTLSALEQRLLAAGLCSYVSVPMLVQNELVGAINMASPRPDFFQPAHVEILNEIAASLAVAMQQANLLAQTQEDAESKTLLLQEVNHRVMNNLHMIQSILELEMEQSPPRTDRDLDTVLRDIRSRVQGIATVHRMLSSAQRDALDLAQLTSAIVDAASSGAPIPYQVAVAIDAPPDVPHVSAKQAVTLALVLNELTTNSVKYAFADRMGGEIRVCIERTAAEIGAGVRLVFQDDGPGWPDDVLAGERHSMGLWLIQASVTHNLGGEIAWYNEDGAVVEIRFPIRG